MRPARPSALPGRHLARRVLVVLASLLAIGASSAGTIAAELLMVRQPGCSWCLLWDKEIGAIYPASEEGRFAPLRHVDLRDKLPAFVSQSATMTPTFILIENDREVGRITGYPGESFFWEMLSDILEKSSFRKSAQP